VTEPATPLVRELMSSPVASVDRHATLWRVWELLARTGLRHVAVMDGGRCVGVLCDRDILLHVPLTVEWLRSHRVHSLLTGPFVTVTPDTPVPLAAGAMHRGGCDAAPVVTVDGDLVGILTATDLVAYLGGQEAARSRPGRRAMMVASTGEAVAGEHDS
jgi:acetoin utilization protein AcuB